MPFAWWFEQNMGMKSLSGFPKALSISYHSLMCPALIAHRTCHVLVQFLKSHWIHAPYFRLHRWQQRSNLLFGSSPPVFCLSSPVNQTSGIQFTHTMCAHMSLATFFIIPSISGHKKHSNAQIQCLNKLN